ncbi:SHOCT domain-containing protein [Schleiferilactobacillus harbinensis]|uniref:SHOCT domain-containing protein n=1 Tax=Schleiferilactobacillus harbinensis TaxID=304207 RepID=UPI00345ED399
MVKIGVRKQSWKKSVAARTKGQFTRSVKRAIIPGYGKRGAGWAHPRRKLYNKAYSRSTVSVRDLVSGRKKKRRQSASMGNSGTGIHLGCFGTIALAILIVLGIHYWHYVLIGIVAIGVLWYLGAKQKKEDAAKQAAEEQQQAEQEDAKESETDSIIRLRQYKELLDQGAITQAEFEAKEKKLLSWDDTPSSHGDWKDF